MRLLITSILLLSGCSPILRTVVVKGTVVSMSYSREGMWCAGHIITVRTGQSSTQEVEIKQQPSFSVGDSGVLTVDTDYPPAGCSTTSYTFVKDSN